jgi:hypothetical protein
MARHPRPDRSTVADRTVGVRLTPPLQAAMRLAVERQNRLLEEQGLAVTVTPASVLRSLFLRQAKADGFLHDTDDLALERAPAPGRW